MKNLKFFLLLNFGVFNLFLNSVFCQIYDRNLQIAIGSEYPLYEDKYNPYLTCAVYFIYAGIEIDYGWLLNDKKINEFELNSNFGNSVNYNLFTKFDLNRINSHLKRFTILPGYKYTVFKLTKVSDLFKSNSHYLFLRTEYHITDWCFIYSKLDYKIYSENVINDNWLVTFGFGFGLMNLEDKLNE